MVNGNCNRQTEIRSGTDKHGNPKYAAYGETYGGKFTLVVYVVERADLWKILSARTRLNRAETRLVRQRRK